MCTGLYTVPTTPDEVISNKIFISDASQTYPLKYFL
jgi:hypothetical protein